MMTTRFLSRRAAVVATTWGAACAGLVLALPAQAGSNVYWSVGVTVPGVGVGASNAYPVYSTPTPVYVQPRPVYVQPQPVYVQPQPVYVQPQPVYVQPRPIYAPPPVYYSAPVSVQPQVVVAPAPVYSTGWRGRGHPHRRHRHGWEDGGWRY